MRDPPIPWARGFLPAAGLIVALQLAVAGGSGWSPLAGEFWGPDSYMRLARTLACDGGAACPGGVFADTNAPFGEVIHWPFLQDRLLLVLAAPFALFLGWHDAVLVAASFLGPLLAIGGVALILLAARTVVPRAALYFVGVLLACQPWVFQAFAAPRVDHHGLQGFLFLGMVAGALHLLASPGARRWALMVGAFLGLAMWVSTEALVSALPVLGGLAALWLVKGGRLAARANRDVALAAVGVLTLGLLVDAPSGEPLAAQYDRFSVVHWALFALMTGLWWALGRLDGVRETGLAAGLRGRLLWGFAAALGWVAAVAVLFPDFFGGPMVAMDGRLAAVWLDRTSEFVPVVDRARPLVVSLHLASPLLALPAAVVCALAGNPPRRGRWWLLVGALIWFAGLTTFLHGRWGLYLHLLAPIPLAWLLARMVELAASAGPTPLFRTAAKVTSVSVVVTFPFLFALPLARAEERAEPIGSRSSASCSAASIVPLLQELEIRRGPGIVLAPADWGPEIVFRTGHRAVASPYHRNADGLLDSQAFMSAADEEVARAVATQRGIDWVVLCRGAQWFPALVTHDGPTLHASLSAGQPPSWLRQVPLPDSLSQSYGVFQVAEGLGPRGPTP